MKLERIKIAVIPGDGAGKEVIMETLRILDKIEESTNITFEKDMIQGGQEYAYKKFYEEGEIVEWEPDALDRVKKSDAILFGAIGQPRLDIPEIFRPDGEPVGYGILFESLRFGLDLYANVRPIKLYKGAPTPLRNVKEGEIDLVIVRENTEGLYTKIGGNLLRGLSLNKQFPEMSIDVRIITEKACERILRFGFNLALKRRKKVTIVDKSNFIESDRLFRKMAEWVAEEYEDVQTNYYYVDTAAMRLVTHPQKFDVIITPNLYGDILSDLAAGLIGGLGLAPSAEIGDKYAMFEPVHGTAPDIAGKNLVNPMAAILSLKMMFEWFYEKKKKEIFNRIAKIIEDSVETTLSEGKIRTIDLCTFEYVNIKPSTTREVTNRIIHHIERKLGDNLAD